VIDWGLGRYERTAAELEPVAADLVARAGLSAGERVLDVACGTGNAALIAGRAGAAATGLDGAERLIEVARGRAAAEGLRAAFVVGDAQALPFEDGAFDAVLSVFGIIFAADADRAFTEVLRVLRPGGRALLTAWVPEGPIDAMVGVLMRELAEVAGPAPRRFAWHDPDAVGAMADRHGAQVGFEDGEIAFAGESPESYFADGEANHPMSVASRPLLERAGRYEAARERAIAILRDGNEDPERFRVTSRYRVIRVERPGT
jgi:SAM-dependent methyltransferase